MSNYKSKYTGLQIDTLLDSVENISKLYIAVDAIGSKVPSLNSVGVVPASQLPVASDLVPGIVRLGSGLSMNSEGKLEVTVHTYNTGHFSVIGDTLAIENDYVSNRLGIDPSDTTGAVLTKSGTWVTYPTSFDSTYFISNGSLVTINPASIATTAALDTKVDKDGSKVLSDVNFSTAYAAAIDTINTAVVWLNANAVIKVPGKDLSTNDYTDTDKAKVNMLMTTGSSNLFLAADGRYYYTEGSGGGEPSVTYNFSEQFIVAGSSVSIDTTKIMPIPTGGVSGQVLTSAGGTSVVWSTISQGASNTFDTAYFIVSGTLVTLNTTAVVTAARLTEVANTKVDKVAGKDLSTNDYTATDKAKVDMLVNDGGGDKFLSNAGTYVSITGSGVSYTFSDQFTVTGSAVSIDTTIIATKASVDLKVDKVSGKSLSTNDYTSADKAEVAKVKDKQDTLVGGDTQLVGFSSNKATAVNKDSIMVTSLNNARGAVVLKGSDGVIFEVVDNTITIPAGGSSYTFDDTQFVVNGSAISINTNSIATKASVDLKVDKVSGKGLSTNDYTAADKAKVDIIDNSGDGSMFLANDGTYKVGGGGSSIKVEQFTAADLSQGQLTLTAAPILVVSNTSKVYPIDKDTLTIANNIFKLAISNYVTYENKASMEGTWTVYYSSGGSGGEGATYNFDETQFHVDADNNVEIDTTVIATKASVDLKVDKDGTKVLSTNDYTNADRLKVNALIMDGDGSRVLTNNGEYIPLDAGDYTFSDQFTVTGSEVSINTAVIATKASVDLKVDKDGTKVLSTNDYTNADKAEVAKIATNASDIQLLQASKVDKVENKSLILDSEIARLSTVTNYDDTEVKYSLATIHNLLPTFANTDMNNLTRAGRLSIVENMEIDIANGYALTLGVGVALTTSSYVYIYNGPDLDAALAVYSGEHKVFGNVVSATTGASEMIVFVPKGFNVVMTTGAAGAVFPVKAQYI